MGILPTPQKAQEKAPPSNGQRRSMQADLSKLKPLDPNGLKGFSQFRDPLERDRDNSNGQVSKHDRKRSNDMDSDDDVEIHDDPKLKIEEGENKDSTVMLSPEDARRQGELADGVQKIRVSIRIHSAFTSRQGRTCRSRANTQADTAVSSSNASTLMTCSNRNRQHPLIVNPRRQTRPLQVHLLDPHVKPLDPRLRFYLT